MDNVNKTRFQQLRTTGDVQGARDGNRPQVARDSVRAPRLGARNYIKIAFQAIVRSIQSDRTRAEIRTELKNEIIRDKKVQIALKAERRDHAISQRSSYRRFEAPDLVAVAQDPKGKTSPLPLSEGFFIHNPVAFFSKVIDGYTRQAKRDGAGTPEEIRNHIRDAFANALPNLSMGDITAFDRDAFNAHIHQFQSEFRTDKAVILSDIAGMLDDMLKPDNAIRNFDETALQSITQDVEKQSRTGGKDKTFQRGAESKHIGFVLQSLGMKDLAKTVAEGLRSLDQRQDRESNSPTHPGNRLSLEPLPLANSLIEVVERFRCPPELKDKIDGYCDPIREACRDGRLDKALATKLIREHYLNAVILRVVNPVAISVPGIGKELRDAIKPASALIQKVTNLGGKDNVDNQKLATRIDTVLRVVFGMDTANLDQTTSMRELDRMIQEVGKLPDPEEKSVKPNKHEKRAASDEALLDTLDTMLFLAEDDDTTQPKRDLGKAGGEMKAPLDLDNPGGMFGELDEVVEGIRKSIGPKPQDRPEPDTGLDLDELLESEEPTQDQPVKQRVRQEVEIIEVENDESMDLPEDDPSEFPQFSEPDYDDKGAHNKKRN